MMEDRLKQLLGELIFNNVALQFQVEQLNKQLEAKNGSAPSEPAKVE